MLSSDCAKYTHIHTYFFCPARVWIAVTKGEPLSAVKVRRVLLEVRVLQLEMFEQSWISTIRMFKAFAPHEITHEVMASRSTIFVFEAHDIVFTEVGAGLHFNQFQGDDSRIF